MLRWKPWTAPLQGKLQLVQRQHQRGLCLVHIHCSDGRPSPEADKLTRRCSTSIVTSFSSQRPRQSSSALKDGGVSIQDFVGGGGGGDNCGMQAFFTTTTTQGHANTTAACIGRLKAALFVGMGPTLEPGRASAGPRVTREARPATVQAQLCLIE